MSFTCRKTLEHTRMLPLKQKMNDKSSKLDKN